MSMGSPYNMNEQGVSVNVNGSMGSLVWDPTTGQYVVDVNTTGHPVYGQPVAQSAFLSSSVAGIPVMWIVIGLFVVAVIGLMTGRKVINVS